MKPSLDSLLREAESLAKSGNTAQAIETFERAYALEPNRFEVVLWLSMLYRKAGKPSEAVRFAKHASELRPLEGNVHSNLGLSYLANQEFANAAKSFVLAAELSPTVAQNYHQLGMALQLQGLDSDAVAAFRRATGLAPRSLESWLALGQSLSSQNDPSATQAAAREALKLSPNSAMAHLMLAGALISDNQTGKAQGHIEKAIALDPKESTSHALLGMRQQAIGHMEEAMASFRKSIEIQPNQGFAYCALMRSHKVTPSEQATIDQMEALVNDGALPARGRSFLHYGLGKAYEDIKNYEAAMEHFNQGNRLAHQLKFGHRKFDSRAYSRWIDWTIDTFDKQFLSNNASPSVEKAGPIFIVGMMRSGTTLVEQILSSHPEVEATGEQRFWMTRGYEAIRPLTAYLDRGRLSALAKEYAATLEGIAPGANYLTDKMPDNYTMLGLIHLALPNAKFIHTRRNAADTCISIYSTPNPAPIDWAHDKGNIAFAYKEHLRLMEHWKRVVPSDRLLTVRYEELVSNREDVTRGMIDFCGLPWDELCLRPEENDRTVITPSVWQVRQPVYTTSMERWRRYEPFLGEFQQLVGL